MKKKNYVLLLFAMLSILSGCTKPDDVKPDDTNDIPAVSQNGTNQEEYDKNKKIYTLTPNDYVKQGWGKFNLALHNECIIYFEQGTFYSYNLEKNISEPLGTIANAANYQSGDFYTIHKNQLYTYVNESDCAGLYKTDLEKKTTEKIADEKKEEQFVSIEATQDKLFMLKQSEREGQKVSFVKWYDLTAENCAEFTMLLSETYDSENETGKIYLQFTIDDDILYLLTYDAEDTVCPWKIEKYNVRCGLRDVLKKSKNTLEMFIEIFEFKIDD